MPASDPTPHTWKNSATLATWLAQAHFRASGTSSPTCNVPSEGGPQDRRSGRQQPTEPEGATAYGPRLSSQELVWDFPQQWLWVECGHSGAFSSQPHPTAAYPVDEHIFWQGSLGVLDTAETVHHFLVLEVAGKLLQAPFWGNQEGVGDSPISYTLHPNKGLEPPLPPGVSILQSYRLRPLCNEAKG